jgi:hypothetical protein
MDFAGSGRLFRKNNVPKHYTKKDCKHWLCAVYKTITQMKTSELDDGGGNQS